MAENLQLGEAKPERPWGGHHHCPPLSFLLTAQEITALQTALKPWPAEKVIDAEGRPVGFWFQAENPDQIISALKQALGESAPKLEIHALDRSQNVRGSRGLIWPINGA